MSRVVSGVVLGVVFFALIWFANAMVLLAVAITVCALALREYASLMKALGANVPVLVTLIASVAVLWSVPFPYLTVEVVLGAGVLVIAIATMMRAPGGAEGRDEERFRPAIRAVAAAVFAPHVVWQIAEGFPTFEFIRNAQAEKIVAMSPLDYLGAQIVQTNPLLLPLWIAGLAYLLFG